MCFDSAPLTPIVQIINYETISIVASSALFFTFKLHKSKKLWALPLLLLSLPIYHTIQLIYLMITTEDPWIRYDTPLVAFNYITYTYGIALIVSSIILIAIIIMLMIKRTLILFNKKNKKSISYKMPIYILLYITLSLMALSYPMYKYTIASYNDLTQTDCF